MFGPIGMLSGLPFVLHFHGGDLIEDDRSGCWHRIHVAAAGKARRCLVSTPDLLSYERRLPVRLEFLPNPVCVDVERGAGGGGVMFASKLDSRKGAEIFLPAAIRLARSGYPVTVLGFGSVAHSFRDELEQLRGLGGRVVSRRIPQTAFNSLLADADVVAGQFSVGALGMSELDAMARGRAVVTKFDFPDAYRTPPALVRAHTTDAIVAAVEGLLKATDRRDALGFEARQWVLEEHHPNTVRARLLDIYRDALAA
jgi:glycosyltransferase involved in cell wall biosynthesis